MRRFSFIALLLLIGCTHHVRIDNPFVRPGERHSRWVNGFLWNLVGGRVSTAEFCGNRPVAAIDTKKSFGNTIIGWLTLGIYTPMHVTVICGEPLEPNILQLLPNRRPLGYGMPQHYAPALQ